MTIRTASQDGGSKHVVYCGRCIFDVLQQRQLWPNSLERVRDHEFHLHWHRFFAQKVILGDLVIDAPLKK